MSSDALASSCGRPRGMIWRCWWNWWLSWPSMKVGGMRFCWTRPILPRRCLGRGRCATPWWRGWGPKRPVSRFGFIRFDLSGAGELVHRGSVRAARLSPQGGRPGDPEAVGRDRRRVRLRAAGMERVGVERAGDRVLLCGAQPVAEWKVFELTARACAWLVGRRRIESPARRGLAESRPRRVCGWPFASGCSILGRKGAGLDRLPKASRPGGLSFGANMKSSRWALAGISAAVLAWGTWLAIRGWLQQQSVAGRDGAGVGGRFSGGLAAAALGAAALDPLVEPSLTAGAVDSASGVPGIGVAAGQRGA